MKRFLATLLFIAACGCHRETKVPTVKELESNPTLLSEWQYKCEKGEYSKLGQMERLNFCASTNAATESNASKSAHQEEMDSIYRAIKERSGQH